MNPAEPEQREEIPAPDRCWCGVKNPYYAPLPRWCEGSGTIYCRCGGDLCVCHWHGEAECLGCSNCREQDDIGGQL